jgi:hypothetical protein
MARRREAELAIAEAVATRQSPPLLGGSWSSRVPQEGGANRGRQNGRDEHRDLAGREIELHRKCLGCNEQRHRKADTRKGTRAGKLSPCIGDRLRRNAKPHRYCRRTQQANRFSERKSNDNRKHQDQTPTDHLRKNRDLRIGECEDWQHHVACSRAGMAKQPVGGGLDPIVDCIERLQRRD